MKRLITYLLLLSLTGAVSGQKHAAFLSDPAISPDGSAIVFVYESDLWIADRSGGTAHRLTAMAGEESVPRFSPDGQWLAFSSTQNGNADIYVMPFEGGRVVQHRVGSKGREAWKLWLSF
jgi:tricorn protease